MGATLKRFLAGLALLVLPFIAHAQRTLEVVNTIQDLLAVNPANKNTNYFVVSGSSFGDDSGGIFTFLFGSSAATNGSPTNVYAPYPPNTALGRWFKMLPTQQATSGNLKVEQVATLADLVGLDPLLSQPVVLVRGYSSEADGRGGQFWWSNGDSSTTNSWSIIGSSIASGRWFRLGLDEGVSSIQAQFDWAKESVQTLKLTNNVVLSFLNIPTGTNLLKIAGLMVTNMGSFTLTQPAQVTTTPSQPATNDVTFYTYVWDGQSVKGFSKTSGSGGAALWSSDGTTLIPNPSVGTVNITSHLADDPSNVVLVMNTESAWTGGSIAVFKNGGSAVASISAVSGYDGSGTHFLSDDGTYKSLSEGVSGTVVNTGASTTSQFPKYADATGTNVAPHTLVNGDLPGSGAFTLTVTNGTVSSADASVALGGTLHLGLPNVGTVGTFGDASHFAVITTDAQGRITTVTTNALPSGTVGTMINTGASTTAQFPKYTDTTGTNVAPHTITTSDLPGSGASTITDGAGIGAGATLTVGSAYTVSTTNATPQFTREGLGVLPADSVHLLNINPGTITTDVRPININGTWNAGGVTFKGIFLNITNTASASNSKLFDFQIGGVTKANSDLGGTLTLAGNCTVQSLGQYSFGANGGLSALGSSSFQLGNGLDTAATLKLGGNITGSALTHTITTSSGSGSNIPSGALSIQTGTATGNAHGGFIRIQTDNAGASGSTAQALSTRYYAVPKWVDLTESSATKILNIAIGSSKYMGVELFCTIDADDGTDFQSISSRVSFDAVNKGGTVTVGAVGQIDNTTAASSGTLTVTYTAVANGATVDIKANAVSSLTQTTLRCKMVVTALNTDDAGTFVEQ